MTAQSTPQPPLDRRRIWGWYFFDWASQPYNTLLLTFIFATYFAKVAKQNYMANGLDPQAADAMAQSVWGMGLTVTGVIIAIMAPILGAIADNNGHKRPWIWLFSAMYVIGSAGLWWSAPEAFSATKILILFGIGLIGMEFATIFSNSYLPSMGPRAELGRISGSGWAFGYVGGLIALIMMLGFFQADDTGKTMLGRSPLFGLDTASKADTRIVGPISAIWFAVFMIPFFMYVHDRQLVSRSAQGVRAALGQLVGTIRSLPKERSLFSFLMASMFYRDGLNGMYTFGGIYAALVLEWSIIEIGIFGIAAVLSGAFFCWIGGYIDKAVGPKPVIVWCCLIMMLTAILIVSLSPTTVFWVPVAEGSGLPNIMFYIAGMLIGAAGGVLQSSSRHMLTRQANPARMTEAFGLYALSGKATSFLAPGLITLTTHLTGDQRLGVSPLIALFTLGLVLMIWVRADGGHKGA